jgi:geranylgeranyl pyrophosphate synthase
MLEQKITPLLVKPTFMAASWSDPIRVQLAAVESRLREVPEGQHPVLTGAIEGLFGAGGKRVRPALSLLTAGIFGVDEDQAVSVAAAVEMLHTATLVHDDLIDGAMLRRGAPTLNSIWSSDVSVLVGDYLFSRAASLIARVKVVDIMDLFADTLSIILNGEITQKFSKWQIDRQEYDQRIYAKTAALFVLSAQSAAILGGADSASLSAVIEFSHNLGMAFQIVDDVLDYVGKTDKLGKPIGGDLRQGLFTLPAILYDEAHPDDQDIQYVLDKRDGNPEAVEKLIRKIQKSGAIGAAMQEAYAFLEKGQYALEFMPNSIYKDALFLLAEVLVNREM